MVKNVKARYFTTGEFKFYNLIKNNQNLLYYRPLNENAKLEDLQNIINVFNERRIHNVPAKALNDIGWRRSEVDIFSLEEIKKAFPDIDKKMIHFYLHSLTKKNLIGKIKNGLYFFPVITLQFSELSLNSLLSYIGFKKNSFIFYEDKFVLRVFIERADKYKIPYLKKMLKGIAKNLDNFKMDDMLRRISSFKLKIIIRQDFEKKHGKTIKSYIKAFNLDKKNVDKVL